MIAERTLNGKAVCVNLADAALIEDGLRELAAKYEQSAAVAAFNNDAELQGRHLRMAEKYRRLASRFA